MLHAAVRKWAAAFLLCYIFNQIVISFDTKIIAFVEKMVYNYTKYAMKLPVDKYNIHWKGWS